MKIMHAVIDGGRGIVQRLPEVFLLQEWVLLEDLVPITIGRQNLQARGEQQFSFPECKG